ncbi:MULTISPECIES: PssD/Cps14F family polysaccharide biosynthesis glycosyltransferase [Priestia]|jgi:UDP-N-acetylglucosamine:LPS N-acetylglucosamine transferase|uniref:Polysaccharide biosynthesis protein n=3 Tax=Priestia TaxID=2800373 RepID=A0A1X7FRG9_9BACI|nr:MULTISPECIES: PssD/Cps14F family polysaccharide biosynthesis glycosyltransferase [Priestia]AKO94733.1 polysaccharide biosynthesis protein [Priestia filamentosa]KAB2490579.1 polysaccharide biosynthesis protein [Priestia endophytica]KYG28504.1 polysaccharide biosynthesis protein [Priestia endophytica]MBG9810715.1 polysaccharide biosynthesis protein [Priestia endophytica]MCM3540255.1 UDP-N-acetylglucosamine transferase subunit ALG14 [Priestia endophytica]
MRRKKNKQKKVLFIASVGGHLTQLLQLKPLFQKYDYHIITERSVITEALQKEYKMSFLVYGARNYLFRYLFKFTYNCFKSLYLFLREKPDVIVTTGAHTAVPMCYIAKLFGKKVIFIESFAKTTTPTISGRLVYPIADLFIVQWETMKVHYPKAVHGGSIY